MRCCVVWVCAFNLTRCSYCTSFQHTRYSSTSLYSNVLYSHNLVSPRRGRIPSGVSWFVDFCKPALWHCLLLKEQYKSKWIALKIITDRFFQPLWPNLIPVAVNVHWWVTGYKSQPARKMVCIPGILTLKIFLIEQSRLDVYLHSSGTQSHKIIEKSISPLQHRYSFLKQ